MIKILDKSDEPSNQDLFIQMFRGRAAVFRDRLRWPVDVRNGLEIDDYDREANPTYLIATDGAGTVIGSLRILPATGPTMLGKEFAGMFPDLWEIEVPRSGNARAFVCTPRPPRIGGPWISVHFPSS